MLIRGYAFYFAILFHLLSLSEGAVTTFPGRALSARGQLRGLGYGVRRCGCQAPCLLHHFERSAVGFQWLHRNLESWEGDTACAPAQSWWPW